MNPILEHSKFWLGNNFDLSKSLDKDNVMDLIQLAAYRRAVSNFVYILTGKSIPVRFAEKTTSSTDGKVIFIGGELAKGEFDPTVGLALHEGSHIVHSDFSILKNLWMKIPTYVYDAAKGKISKVKLWVYAKFILNVVEDRYIDALVYKSSPGYRGYYDSLYDRYFRSPKIDKALQSDSYRTPTLKNYKFRFVYFINQSTDLDALPGLRKIYKMLDLPNILNLSHPMDRFELAMQITEEILNNVVSEEEKKQEQSSSSKDKSDESADEDNAEESGGEGDSESTSDETEEKKEEESEQNKEKTAEAEKRLCGDEPEESTDDLSEGDISDIDDMLDKQEELISREHRQLPFDKDTIDKLNLLEKSGVDLIPVGGEPGIPVVNCLVVNNMTEELMKSDEFPYTTKLSTTRNNPEAILGVMEGITLGTLLGRRLQVRGESRTIKYNRLKNGKFDKRLVSELGFGEEDVFYQTCVDRYKNAHIHVTVDASASMAPKWKKTMKTVVAMAKAASMVNNLVIVISFRSGVVMDKTQRHARSGSEIPYVLIAYDSRKDKFSKITHLFPMLYPYGSTPEGLAFQSILDKIPGSTSDLDSYFVNLSDGEPAFALGYFGEIANLHTRRQINKIRDTGVDVLSYFLESAESTGRTIANSAGFKVMYGRDANFIDVENVTEVAYTMNKKFLLREKN